MQIPNVDYRSQVWTVSSESAIRLANATMEYATALEREHTPDQTTRDLVSFADAITDATRAAKGNDRALELLRNVQRAFDGQDYVGGHEAILEARDVRLRLEALRVVAPEFERPDLADFRELLSKAIGKLDAASKSGWARIESVCRVAGWNLARAIRRCDNVGLVVREFARTGLLPLDVDPRLPFSAVPDLTAPMDSPAWNSAHVLQSFAREEPKQVSNRKAEEVRVGREIAARIKAIVDSAEEQTT